jgi:hypothetical protein
MAKYSVDNPSPILRRRARMKFGTDDIQLKGKESGRAARFEALDRMIQRRHAARKTLQGKASLSGAAPQQKGLLGRGADYDTEEAIRGRKGRG